MKAFSFNIKKIYLIIFLSIVVLHSFGQVTDKLIGIRNYGQDFEFVQIDCSNDSLIVLNDSLPNFYYTPYFSSAYDASNQKYYLTYGQNMEIIDATNGNVDTIFVFTNINPNYFIHIVFNPIDGFIYGIKYNQSTFDEVFAKFDPSIGTLTDLFPITPIVGVDIGCKAAFDPYLGMYYIQSRNLASINIHTGQVINDIPFQNPTNEWLDHFAYSCSEQRFFGLTNNYHTNENYFSEIDSSSGITSRVNAAPLPTYFFKQYLSGSTIDHSSDIYYYSSARSKLYGIDIHTGNVIYSHDFGPDYQLLFLESASPVACLSNGINEMNEEFLFKAYPNPTNGIFNFALNSASSKSILLQIYDTKGKIIYSEKIKDGTTSINLQSLAKGVYFYKLEGEKMVKSGKIVY
jgi:hypothetical protein